MEFGHFAESAEEFVITRFDTPRPWMNVLFNDEYGLFFSQTGLGYSFYRYVLDIPVTCVDIFTYVPQWPRDGKFVFLRDQETGTFWPLAPMHSAEGYDHYECRHHPGRSTILTRREGIESALLIFVPRGDPVEIWRLTLRNLSRRPRTIRFFPFQELRLASYGTGATDVFTYTLADYDAQANAIIARNNNSISKLKFGAFMTGDYPVLGYDCRLESFVGRYGRPDEPQVLRQGECANSSVSAERTCTVLAGEVELAPDQAKTVHVLFGIGDTPERVAELRERYLAPGAPESALQAVEDYWSGVIGEQRVETPERAVDVFANVWHKHGCLLTSRYVRGGHKGYRDVLQDVMGVCPLDVPWTRRWLLESLKQMRNDGLCVRGYDPIAGLDDLRWHRDSALWIPLTLSAYLRETGESEILTEEVPYRDGGAGSVWDHVMRGIAKVAAERGAHDLCLIGGGDWNDSLDEVNLAGRGESAWLTVACVHAARTAARIARSVGDAASAEELDALAADLTEAVNANAWDGDWYVYAFADNGQPVGSRLNEEGRIHLNVQTWAIFSGVATPERVERLLQAIDGPMDTDFGPVLVHPAYTRYVRGIGKVSAKNPGHCENGPIYGHAVAFKMLADAVLGRGSKAFESYVRMSALSPRTTQDRFRGEPFAAQRYLVGPGTPEQFGAGWYPYFTATPAWMLMVIYEWLLGVRPWYNGLVIDPVIPSSWREYRVRRPWRGAVYEVHVVNPEGVESGVVELTFDGRTVEGWSLPVAADGRVHQVHCRLGRAGARPPATA